MSCDIRTYEYDTVNGQYVLYADHLSVRSLVSLQTVGMHGTAHRGPRSRVSSNGAMHRR